MQQVIHSIFDDKNIPLPVSYLFNLLDSIAEKHNVTDEKILHVWKTNWFVIAIFLLYTTTGKQHIKINY